MVLQQILGCSAEGHVGRRACPNSVVGCPPSVSFCCQPTLHAWERISYDWGLPFYDKHAAALLVASVRPKFLRKDEPQIDVDASCGLLTQGAVLPALNELRCASDVRRVHAWREKHLTEHSLYLRWAFNASACIAPMGYAAVRYPLSMASCAALPMARCACCMHATQTHASGWGVHWRLPTFCFNC